MYQNCDVFLGHVFKKSDINNKLGTRAITPTYTAGYTKENTCHTWGYTVLFKPPSSCHPGTNLNCQIFIMAGLTIILEGGFQIGNGCNLN